MASQDALAPNHNADGTKVIALTISRTTNETTMQMQQNVRNCFKLGNSLMLRCVAFDFTRDSQSRLTTQAQPRRTSDVGRECGTASANRRWLQRMVRPRF